MENNLEVNTEFLNSEERKNSKTFYYLRLVVFHNIPLLTNSEANKIKFYTECLKISGANTYRTFPIYNIRNYHDLKTVQYLLDNGIKVIIDNKEVGLDCQKNLEFSLGLYWGGKMSDDQIREIILSDLVEGKYYYESFDDFLNNLDTSEPKEMRQIREGFEFDLKN